MGSFLKRKHRKNDSQKENRLAMIRQALKDNAPVMYEELESSGRLPRFLEGHEVEMMASYEEAKKKAWKETLSTFLTFADDSYNESSSPMG